MRSKKDIVNDFKLCFLEDPRGGCDGCSYFKNGRCTDDKENNLSMEVLECLESNNNSANDDIWQILKKICCMGQEEVWECFGMKCSLYNIISLLTPDEIVACLNNWNSKKNKLEVGDIVDCFGSNGVLTGFGKEETAYLLFSDGSCGLHKIKDCKRTNGHIDLTSLFTLIDSQ